MNWYGCGVRWEYPCPAPAICEETARYPDHPAFRGDGSGIPLICSPWNDREHLFTAGKDYLSVNNGEEMKIQLKRVLQDTQVSEGLKANALETIRQRHMCFKRAGELMQIVAAIKAKQRPDLYASGTSNHVKL